MVRLVAYDSPTRQSTLMVTELLKGSLCWAFVMRRSVGNERQILDFVRISSGD